jgi:2-methylcitrate dehydratase PrpD
MPMRQTLAFCACTAIGHVRTLTAAGAAFVNGTAAHGEDFDDTFEGGPVHAGAVIVPAVLAACGLVYRRQNGCEFRWVARCRLATTKAVKKFAGSI